MLAARRYALIMELARDRGSVRVTELVDVLGVSDVTVRRDLEHLARAGQLEKVHGGAVLPSGARGEATGPDAPGDGAPRSGELVLGALIPKSSYYFNRVVDGMRRALAGRGGRLLVAVSGYRPGQDEQLANGLVESGAQGLLLTADDVGWAGSLAVPTVLVERRARDAVTAPAGLSWVRTDHESGAALAVRHLHELGHRGIAVFARGDTPTSRAVLHGWDLAVGELGLADGARIVGVDFEGWPTWGAEQVDALAARLRAAGATALLMHSDEDALAVLQSGFASRFSVPRDVSVVAYDDEFSALTSPALTAVSPPKELVGDLAVRTLLDLLEDPASPARHIDVEPRLVVRESTGAPRH